MFKFNPEILMCIVCVSMTSCADSDHPPSRPDKVTWGYNADNGPDVWGRLNPDWALCANGSRQSPIDLRDPRTERLPAIVFNYRPSALDIRHTGHNVDVTPALENWIEVGDDRFNLLQFHFHAPSEHTVDGKPFDMELHLVHRNEQGVLAVIGVLIERGSQHLAFDWFREHLPRAPGENKRINDVSVNILDMLPPNRRTYRYEGSLTTPPCSESVRWMVMATPIELSESQIGAFENTVHRNNRPIQALNGREILIDVERED